MNEKILIEGLVSVIIPVYNSEKYVKETIESVLKQTYQNFEIIIVDDCSTDNSCQIIENIDDQRIQLIQLDKNSGVAVARNIAIENAKGQYIAFLDSDDVWISNKLDTQIDLLKGNQQTPMAYTRITMIDANGKVIKDNCKIKKNISYSFLQKNTMIATSSVVINRSVVKEIEMPNRKSAEDYSLWLSILKRYGNALGIDESLTLYRRHSSSISSSKLKEVRHFYSVQTNDLQIGYISAFINTICYVSNAVIKHFF